MSTVNQAESDMRPSFVEAGGINLAVYTWGQPPSQARPREVIVLAHGFPDRAALWENVARELEKEYFVVAFDMRGCGNSSHIRGTRHYNYAALIQDLFAVIDAVSYGQKVHLVGHDWGGLYGWEAISGPEGAKRIASFITLSPSLEHVGFFLQKRLLRPTPRNLLQAFGQLGRNALMIFFTLPLLPELLWRSGLGVAMMRWLVKRFEPGITYRKNRGVEGDAIRFLGIYRANLLQRTLCPRRVVSTVPVHALLAVNDPFLPPSVFEQCPQGTTAYSRSELNASHWAPLASVTEVAQAVASQVQQCAVATPGDPTPS